MHGIHSKILQVMRSVGSIGKTQTNKFDHYQFRGIDDVYNVLGPAFAEAGIFVTPHVEEIRTDTLETAKGARMYRTIVRARYVFHDAEDGSTVETAVVGEGADRGDKSANKAMSAAFKVAMFQALCIPTADQLDSESESPEHETPQPAASQEPANAAQANAARINQFKIEAGKRAEELGMEKRDGLIVLVDSMRLCGVEKADGKNFPGLIIQACEKDEGFAEHLSIAIDGWETQPEMQLADAEFAGETP